MPHRSAEIVSLCTTCKQPATRTCKRCDRPLCREDAPKRGERCEQCEDDFSRALAKIPPEKNVSGLRTLRDQSIGALTIGSFYGVLMFFGFLAQGAGLVGATKIAASTFVMMFVLGFLITSWRWAVTAKKFAGNHLSRFRVRKEREKFLAQRPAKQLTAASPDPEPNSATSEPSTH